MIGALDLFLYYLELVNSFLNKTPSRFKVIATMMTPIL